MPNQWVNTVGLLFDIVGVLMLFRFGPPQPNLEEGVSLGVASGTVFADGTSVAQINAERRRLKQRHEFFSRLALVLVLIGFALQLLSTWLI